MRKLLSLLALALSISANAQTEETYAGKKYVWDFNSLTEAVTTQPTVIPEHLVLHPGTANGFAVKDVNENGTFADGTPWSAGNCIELTGRTSIKESDLGKRRTALTFNSTFKDHIAFNTSVAGTCHVVYYFKGTPASGRMMNIFFQDEDNNVTSSSTPLVGYETTEVQLKANAGGTFFIQTQQTARIYAIMFVPQQTVSIGSAGLATFTNTNSFSLTLPEGLQAFAAKNASQGKVEFTPVEVLEAGKGYLLKAAQREYTMCYTEAAAGYTGTNYMVGVAEDATVNGNDGNNTNFILANKNGKTAFYKSAGGTLAAGKSYLSLPASVTDSQSKMLTMQFAQTTGIGQAHSEATTAGKTYNMQGREVLPGYKGLVIKNGKKYINKQ